MGQLVFVHISDLHFGKTVNRHSGNWVSGLRSHHIALARALSRAIEGIPAKFGLPSPPPVIVTGDLTARGDDDEFPVAHAFLQAQWHLDGLGESWCGLSRSVPDGRVQTIAGNHDHWNGSRSGILPRAYHPEIMGVQFATCPRVFRLESSDDRTLALEFIALDSNQGWRSGRINSNQSAAGELDAADLDWVRANVAPRPRGVVRCLLSHHGLSGDYAAETPYPRHDWKQLTSESCERLKQIAAHCDAAAVLTGHLHQRFVSPVTIRTAERVRILHELRAATATQGPPRTDAQSFYVHRLVRGRDTNLVQWQTHLYSWHERAFVSSPIPLDDEPSYYDFMVRC